MSLAARLRGRIYDAAIPGTTTAWYGAVLDRLPDGARVLDVGIGTGAALLAHAGRLRARRLVVVGIDIDAAYVARCRAAIARADAGAHVSAQTESVYDHRGGPYDAVYFSASFMLLPDPVAALRHVATLLAPGGRLFFTQTFEHRRSRLVEWIKPLLRRVTTIDFGRVTYESDFRATLAAAGVVIDDFVVLNGGARRSGALVVARPDIEHR